MQASSFFLARALTGGWDNLGSYFVHVAASTRTEFNGLSRGLIISYFHYLQLISSVRLSMCEHFFRTFCSFKPLELLPLEFVIFVCYS